MEKKLIINPDTFIWSKRDECLLYDSHRHALQKFQSSGSVKKMLSELADVDNLYCTVIDYENLDDEGKLFVDSVCSGRFGVLADLSETVISLPPLLNIQNSVEKLADNKDKEMGDDVLRYLSTVNIFVGGKTVEREYYKQVLYPFSSEDLLPSERISSLLNSLYPIVNEINLVISDQSEAALSQLMYALAGFQDKIVCHLLYNRNSHGVYTKITDNGYRLNVIFDFSDPTVIAETTPQDLDKTLPDLSYTFLVDSARAYSAVSDIVSKITVDHNVLPVFNENFEFFRSQVFLTEDDILQSELSKREIFAHTAVNTNNFGIVSVLPDGYIYSDLLGPPLGRIGDSIYDIILNELSANHSWRKTRGGACSDCLYQYLCPSPSAYEGVMNIDKVCNFR